MNKKIFILIGFICLAFTSCRPAWQDCYDDPCKRRYNKIYRDFNYYCGRCGHMVGKYQSQCSYCGAWLD